MAREEIKLVGSFDDQITKKLQKLNKEITNMSRSFERFNKKLAPVTKSFAKMAMSAKEFSNAMQTQRGSIEGSARAMREYSRQAGKMTGAMRKITAEREKARRAQGVSRAQARAGGGVDPITGSTAGKGGKGGGASFGASAGKSFMSNVASTAIGVGIANAFASGVSKLGNLFMAPFSKFGSAFKERIGDEMDDIKSAGGLFALDMDLTAESGNERFFKNYNESLRFQEKLNIDMAESAAALPGVTSQYVSTSRQLTDTIQMVMEKDRESFNKMAARYGADISQGGVEASKNAMQTILKKQTEQVVLQSQGQQGGLPMHIAIQQLMGKEAKDGKIGVQAFTNKFRAAFQKNPLLKNFLLRAEKDLAATDAGSVERLQKIIEVFDAAMPKEVINKMRGSISGMQEALRSGLMDPQAGLFGMSRAVYADVNKVSGQFIDKQGKLLKKNVDDFGNVLFTVSDDIFNVEIAEQLGLAGEKSLKGQELTLEQLTKIGATVDKNNMVISREGKKIGEVSRSTTYLFEQIREIMAGFGPVLLEFVGFLPMLFDPFADMTTALMPIRDKAQEFIAGFNKNIDVLEEVAQNLAANADNNIAALGAQLKGQTRARAAIGKVVTFLEGVGGIDKELAGNIFDVVEDVSAEGIKGYDEAIIGFIEPLFKSLIESDLAKTISKAAGTIVGGIIKTTYQLISGAFGLAEGGAANALVDGFREGFDEIFADLGGFEAILPQITNILTVVLSKALELFFKAAIPVALLAIKSFFVGLLNSGPIGQLIAGFLAVSGIKKLAVIIRGLIGAFTGLVSFISYLSPLLTSIGGIIMTAVQGLAAAFVPIILPILAVAGAVMLVIAIVRNFGSIMKMIGGVIKMVAGQIVENFSKVFGALGTVLSWIPGVRKVGEAMKKGGEAMLGFGRGLKEEGLKDVKDAQADMAKQFKEDTDKIKKFATGLNPATTAIGEFAGATKDATKAQKKAAAVTPKTFDSKTKNALLQAGVSESQVQKMEARQPEIDEQLAKLRSGDVHGPSAYIPYAPSAELTKEIDDQLAALRSGNVHAAVKETTDAMENVTGPAKDAGDALDKATSSTETFTDKIEETPAKVETALVGAATEAGKAITQAAATLAQALNSAAQSIKNAASASATASTDTAKGAYGGSGNMTKSMPLADAIATEKKNMPSGAGLVIANTSETIIPAFAGHAGDGFKGLSFAELESAAGFDRMASYTDQIAEIADKTAASFMGGFGGALGGGSATLNAMEALGNANGLITTSGFRPGDPGFHGANRARDLSNGGGETPEMNKVANIMATNFGQSLTELIYTPMGFSIKNGQKTGLISPANHYHHIHVAVAEGLQKAAVFSSQAAAEKYERSMMPAGSEPMKVNLGSMTANSSEVGGVQIGSINVHGVDDPKAIAEQVADEILHAVQRSSYTELFTS